MSIVSLLRRHTDWGLRDYNLATWEGGNPECDHLGPPKASGASTLKNDGRPADKVGQNEYERMAITPYRNICVKCGAVRHDEGIGMESTVEEYISNMLQVGREIWRVLRSDGQFFINIGDTRSKDRQWIGVPQRLILALQADGWRWEDEIVWHKRNPIPSSATNRFTRSHELIFMLNKSLSAFFDVDAVREEHTQATKERHSGKYRIWDPEKLTKANALKGVGTRHYFTKGPHPAGRNLRTVWSIASQSFPGAHFATFPEKLLGPMIKVGASEKGCCPKCGDPWKRVVTKTLIPTKKAAKTFVIDNRDLTADKNDQGSNRQKDGHKPGYINQITTKGFHPTCNHYNENYLRDFPQARGARKRYQRMAQGDWWKRVKQRPVLFDWPIEKAIVLDPFSGSGTTGLVSRRLGRNYVGIDLSIDYVRLSRERLGLDVLEAWNRGEGIKDDSDLSDLPLFA